jgi:hypothetical protein
MTFFLIHFVTRAVLGWGTWYSDDEASRMWERYLFHTLDMHPWLDLPIAALLLSWIVGSRMRKHPRT